MPHVLKLEVMEEIETLVSLSFSRGSSQLVRWDPLFFPLLFSCGPLPLLYLN